MSTPFRSELGQLQEQLRRSEERVVELEAERAVLHQQLLRGGRPPYVWMIVVLGAALVSGVASFVVTATSAGRRQAQTEEGTTRARAELAIKNEQLASCDARARKTADESDMCSVVRDTLRARLKALDDLERARKARPGRCACEPGDPLCSCL